MDTQLSPFFQQSNPGVSPVAPGAVQANAESGAMIPNSVSKTGSDLIDAVKAHRQNVQDQSDVDTAFPMVVKQMGAAGIAPDPSVLAKFGSSSLSAKKGMIGALATQYATQMKAKTDAAQIQESQARAGYYGDVGAARLQTQQETAQDDAGMANVFSRFVNDPASLKSVPAATANVLKAFAGPNVNPRVQAQVMRSVLPTLVNTDGTSATPKFITLGDDKIPVIYGKGGQFQIDPAYADNLKAKNQKDLLDYKSNLNKQLTDGGAKPLMVNGKAQSNVFVMPNGKTLDLRSEVEKQLGDGTQPAADGTGQPTAAPSGDANPLTIPVINGKPDITRMAPGQIYQTARGPATWDGTQFTQ